MTAHERAAEILAACGFTFTGNADIAACAEAVQAADSPPSGWRGYGEQPGYYDGVEAMRSFAHAVIMNTPFSGEQ